MKRDFAIDDALLARLPLAGIEQVTFYKRDKLTTDLICCDIDINGLCFFLHEEARGWDRLLLHLAALPGFRGDWPSHVVNPPFATCEFVAFRRA